MLVWKQGLLGGGDRLTFCDTLLNLSRRIFNEIRVGGDRLTSRCVAVAVLRSTIQGCSFKLISLSQSHHRQQFFCGQQTSLPVATGSLRIHPNPPLEYRCQREMDTDKACLAPDCACVDERNRSALEAEIDSSDEHEQHECRRAVRIRPAA